MCTSHQMLCCHCHHSWENWPKILILLCEPWHISGTIGGHVNFIQQLCMPVTDADYLQVLPYFGSVDMQTAAVRKCCNCQWLFWENWLSSCTVLSHHVICWHLRILMVSKFIQKIYVFAIHSGNSELSCYWVLDDISVRWTPAHSWK
jgi:hypothetical protein